MGHIIRKEGSENFTYIEYSEGKRGQRKTMIILLSLCKWMARQELEEIVRRLTLIKPTKDRKWWRVMIAHILLGHNTIKYCLMASKKGL